MADDVMVLSRPTITNVVKPEIGYPFSHLPRIDYRAHAAYGMSLPRPRLGQRFAAIKAFLKGFAIISIRFIADYEHLPKLTGHKSKLKRLFWNLPGYARLIASQRVGRLRGAARYEPTSARAQDAYLTLQRDGIVSFRLSPNQSEEMRRLLDPHFVELAKRLAQKPPEEQHFDELRLWLDPTTHRNIFHWFCSTLGGNGILEASSAYLGRPVDVAHVNPQINRPTDTFWGNRFPDVGVEDSRCDYCHVDATYNVLKLIIYVSDVGPEQGPFSYVRGSHRARGSFWDGLVRRANDYAALSSTKRSARELFNALPRSLQRKAAFGADIPNNSEYVPAVIDNEWTATSNLCTGVLFDPCGIHRGGMLREGERRVVTLMIAETER